ncbi:hypothetical protein K431DRAFT_280606 [Polychaeton citri CBS 116435]|uniref:Steroid 5-alpha reductase C-terminal domain-containing protein n=1 Tax=Polychaeton citri CBS 116435 TaxID=1314669 RepID=A0A9P4QJ73_9PEZI|nr:hypothetical protein K431DRAFT_280606 [Polychaeton citri CBS 116435]
MADQTRSSSVQQEPPVVPGSSSSGYEPPAWFWQSRVKGPSQSSAILFTGLRTLDVSLQYWLLKSNAIANVIGEYRIAPGALGVTTTATTLGLNPYQSIILGLSVGAALKQIYWNHAINNEVFAAPFATLIAAYNTVFNCVNTGFAIWAVTSQIPSAQSSLGSFITSMPMSIPIGLMLYSIGLFVEWYSEIQRKRFKADPRNAGKPYSGGLFGFARSINYGGYTLWRTGYALVCGGWLWAGAVLAWNAGDFCNRAIPSMDAYCEKRYGRQWDEVRSKVPYSLLPWIY